MAHLSTNDRMSLVRSLRQAGVTLPRLRFLDDDPPAVQAALERKSVKVRKPADARRSKRAAQYVTKEDGAEAERKLATIAAVVASCAGVSLALLSDKRIKGGQVSAARAIIAMMAAHSHVHYPTIAARIGTTSQSAEVIACRLRTATRGDIRLTRQAATDAEALVSYCRDRGWRAWA